MLTPSAMQRRIAGTPAAVPGIFTMTFGRSHSVQRRRASRIDPSVSFARCGPTSIETNPSAPFPASKTGRNASAARRTSSTASCSKIANGSLFSPLARRTSSSYSSVSAIAFWKIVGFDVIPASPSSRISLASSPEVMRSRRM